MFDSIECPYNCKDGKLFNRATKKLETCPHCRDIREKQMRGEIPCEDGQTVAQKLRIPERFTGLAFDMNMVIPSKFQNTRLLTDSVQEVAAVMQGIINEATLGEVPTRSYLFNLGECADANAFVYPLLMRSYKAGLSVAPIVYSMDLQKLRYKFENSLQEDAMPSAKESFGDNYEDYISADICVVVIDAGATMKDVYAVRGIIDNRADKRKATIVITYAYFDRLFSLCTEDDFESLRLATLVQVRYRKSSNGNYQSSQSPALSFASQPSKRDIGVDTGLNFSDI